MDLVKEGKLFAITSQTAEGDGALAVQTAADWFNGKKIPPVKYLPKHIITKADVEEFYPPQW
jgi:ABC-type sugar transport system substrate-binding protein